MKELKKGDRVKIKKFDERPKHWDIAGKMDHLMGEIVTLTDAYNSNDKHYAYDEKEDYTWCFSRSDFDLVCVEKFEKGKRYVFDAALNEADIKDTPLYAFHNLMASTFGCDWTKDIDGKEVNVINETNGTVGIYAVAPEWCREITDTEATKYYSGKIIFVKGDNIFKTGHIYEVVNGRIKDPRGAGTLPYNRKSFTSIEDIEDYFTSYPDRKKQPGWDVETLTFIEVKGELGDEK